MRLFQDEFLVAVTGVILNQNKEVLLFKHSYRNIPWSLPGGYLKQKEHPKEGLRREIFEESGLTVRISRSLKTRTDRQTAPYSPRPAPPYPKSLPTPEKILYVI